MLDEKKTILWKSEMLSYVRGNTCRKIKEKREIDINDQMKLPKPKKKATWFNRLFKLFIGPFAIFCRSLSYLANLWNTIRKKWKQTIADSNVEACSRFYRGFLVIFTKSNAFSLLEFY